MSPELKLTAVMLGALAGLYLARIVERVIQRRERRLRERTDQLMRRGFRRLTQAQLDAALNRKSEPIKPSEFEASQRAAYQARRARFGEDCW